MTVLGTRRAPLAGRARSGLCVCYFCVPSRVRVCLDFDLVLCLVTSSACRCHGAVFLSLSLSASVSVLGAVPWSAVWCSPCSELKAAAVSGDVVEAACSVLFSPGRASGFFYPVCCGAMCRGRAAEVGSRGGGEAPPSLLVASRAPALGRPKLRGIKTNAQPARATSPCRSAHLLVMFLGEEMVGCHVSVSSHVMPLPILVHSLGHQFASPLRKEQPGPGPLIRVQPPGPCFPAARVSKTGLLGTGDSSLPELCDASKQPPSSAQRLV